MTTTDFVKHNGKTPSNGISVNNKTSRHICQKKKSLCDKQRLKVSSLKKSKRGGEKPFCIIFSKRGSYPHFWRQRKQITISQIS